MKAFVKQAESTPETKAKKVCYTISTGVSASAGGEIETTSAKMSASAEIGASISVESCDEWKEVPGGYTVYL